MPSQFPAPTGAPKPSRASDALLALYSGKPGQRTVTVQTSAAMPKTVTGEDALIFYRLQGTETLGELYTYVVEMKTPPDALFSQEEAARIDYKALLGKEITVSISLDGMGTGLAGSIGAGVREISGIITEARFVRTEKNNQLLYALTVKPWIYLLTLTTDYKRYQQMTVVEIVESVLAKYTFSVDWRISQTYPSLEYQVQYGESDFDFICRMMAEFGLYFYFEHSNSFHRMVIVDSVGVHKSSQSEAYRQIRYHEAGGKIDEEHISTFVLTEKLCSGKFVFDDYHFKTPLADLTTEDAKPRETSHAHQEIYQWPGDYTDPEVGQRLARVRMEELGSYGDRASGSGALRGIACGNTFTLTHHPVEAANREYLVISATFEITENSQRSGERASTDTGLNQGKAQFSFNTEFTVQPTAKIYRSPARPKPQANGPQTAIVTGPAGQEIWCDKYGRVIVQFYWDRYGTFDEKSSCWIQVSSPAQDANFGGIFIPRIGQSVVVEFQNGDPDKPLITARVTSEERLPPWKLPQQNALSGFRSHELGGGGQHNHLIMDDTHGQVQAQFGSEHALSQLNLGYITRIPDTTGRKDYRGNGFELRTDQQGAVRANGLHITTEIRPEADGHVLAMPQTASKLNNAHSLHGQMGGLAEHHNIQTPHDQKNIASALKAHQQAGTQDKAELSQPELILSSAAGLHASSAQNLQLASEAHIALSAQEHVSAVAQKNILLSAFEQFILYVHRQGMKLFAERGDIQINANAGGIELTAQKDIKIASTQGKIELQSTQEIHLNVAGTYYILTPGGIKSGTTGAWLVHAAGHTLTGPDSLPASLMPGNSCEQKAETTKNDVGIELS